MSGIDELPEPSFDVLMQVVAGPCLVHLGMVDNPATGKREPDASQAKWCIDLLQVLEEKTSASLDDTERATIGKLLGQLRTAYLQATK